jgi:hypothetical protein
MVVAGKSATETAELISRRLTNWLENAVAELVSPRRMQYLSRNESGDLDCAERGLWQSEQLCL